MQILILTEIDPNNCNDREHYTNLKMFQPILKILTNLGHKVDIHICKTEMDVEEAVLKSPDFIINFIELFEGTYVHTYKVDKILENSKIPFYGNNSKTTKTICDKKMVKEILLKNNILTPALVNDEETRCIVKSATEHSSLGLDQNCVVVGKSAAEKVIAEKKAQYGGEWFAEELIEGDEIFLALIERSNEAPDVFAIQLHVDLLNNPYKIYDEHAKWVSETKLTSIPCTDEMRRVTQVCWSIFNISYCLRLDVRIRNNQLYVIDVNTKPFLSDDFVFGAFAAHKGETYAELIQRLFKLNRFEKPH